MEQRTLEAALKFYCDEELDNAHNAAADTLATYKVLKGQLDRYADTLENDMYFLQEFTQSGKHKKIDFVGRLAVNENGEVIYNFGKHSGKTLEEIYQQEPGYYRWILDNNFPKITKMILQKHMHPILEKAKAERIKRKEQKERRMENKLDQLKNKFNNQ
jgi:DNA polymerase-3 subunit epsilon